MHTLTRADAHAYMYIQCPLEVSTPKLFMHKKFNFFKIELEKKGFIHFQRNINK